MWREMLGDKGKELFSDVVFHCGVEWWVEPDYAAASAPRFGSGRCVNELIMEATGF